jgi:hypothetical protein
VRVTSPLLRFVFVVGFVTVALVVGAGPGEAWGEEKAGSSALRRDSSPKSDEAESEAGVVATEVGDEGVKTYAFRAVEVEGRLRSPQMIYFLRRVRAEFDPAGLGHRSFMRELSDTRRHPVLR